MKPDDLHSIVHAVADGDPCRLRYRDDDAFHDECVYCEAEPNAGEDHDPQRCLRERARAVLAAAPPREGYAAGVREGMRRAGRLAGRRMGLRVKAERAAAQARAAAEDRRRRALLSAELGEGRALSWEEITRRLAELHRERYHFEALARAAGRC